MTYQNHPRKPLTPESKWDKWAEKMTVREFAYWMIGFAVLFGLMQLVWWVTA